MSVFKGTKGKISIRQQRARHGIGKKFILENEYCFIAEVSTCIGYTTDDEVKANAVLFSKSRELLMMLEKVNESLLNNSASIEQVELQKEISELIKQSTEL